MNEDIVFSITPIISGMFALAGVFLGSHLKSKGGEKKEKREIRIRAFTKLVSLKSPLTQTMQTSTEAKILCEFYEARYKINGDISDLEEAKSQNSRIISLTPEVSKFRGELASAIAEIKIAFDLPKEKNDLLMAVYKAKAFEVPEIAGKIKTVKELDAWKIKSAERLSQILQEEYSDKIEALITEIYPEFDKL